MKTLFESLTTPVFEPTREQEDIYKAAKSGGNLVIKAFAGSGKTATGVGIAKRCTRQGYMILFNAPARRDAEGKMPPHIKVKTGHGLAHDILIKTNPSLQRKLERCLELPRQNISAGLIQKHLRLSGDPTTGVTEHQMAMAVQLTLQEFLISREMEVKTTHVPSKAIPLTLRIRDNQTLLMEFTDRVSALTRELWLDMESEQNGFPITHDGYLKLLQLREIQITMPDDMWILDEYQDTNPVLDAIIESQEGQKIYIGDPYQQIYGWRGAVNAMQDKIDAGVPILPLSESFRFNHQIAGLANILLKKLGEKTTLRGQDYNLAQMNRDQSHTVIVRNNLSMLAVIGDALARRQVPHIPKGIPTETSIKIQSAQALYENRMGDVKIPALKELGSWEAFRQTAENLKESVPEYQALVHLIHEYGANCTNLLRSYQTKWSPREQANQAFITITTAHRAKGREWNYIRLTDDLALSDTIIGKLQKCQPLSNAEREQINLLYVAITRCQKGIILPPRIKKNFAELNKASQPTKPRIDED